MIYQELTKIQQIQKKKKFIQTTQLHQNNPRYRNEQERKTLTKILLVKNQMGA